MRMSTRTMTMGGVGGKAHGFAFTGTHRLWTLLNVLGIGVSSHICEQCGAIQWPNVFAASDLHRVNNYYTSLSLSLSFSTNLHQSCEITLRYMQSREPHDQRLTRHRPILVLYGAILRKEI